MRLYLALAVLLALSLPTPVPAEGRADEWSGLPKSLRQKLHYNADDVPAFPGEDSTLLSVHNWPPVKVVDGVPCSLEFRGYDFDVISGPFRALSQIKSGWGYSAGYTATTAPPNKREPRGPTYYWRSDSTLIERAHRAPNGWWDWQYYNGEKPLLYHFQVSSGLNGGTGLDEYFDPNGALVGVESAGMFYWHGQPVHYRDFFAKAEEMYKLYRHQK